MVATTRVPTPIYPKEYELTDLQTTDDPGVLRDGAAPDVPPAREEKHFAEGTVLTPSKRLRFHHLVTVICARHGIIVGYRDDELWHRACGGWQLRSDTPEPHERSPNGVHCRHR
jgi:hypothetical protein